MNKVNFMFGVHNHQPVGNFDGVFQMAFNDCYLPFLKTVEKHPKIRVSLHYTGPLLEWIEYNQPEYFDIIRLLIERKQVEIMGGGFYEPLLPVIPEYDALGQIKMMQDYLNKKFGVTAKGMWLAERVWEPGLPEIIDKSGLKYVMIDDTHFYYAGFKAEDMFGYYITENHGWKTAVFPIDKQLRYRIPFRMPQETIDYLKLLSEKFNNAGVTLADDGEKFGVWPGTHKWVYDDGYLENLFNLLEENSKWINMITFSDYMEKYKSKGKIYLPTSSYDEMAEWSLPSKSQSEFENIIKEFKANGQYDRLRPYLRGGFWRNFLVKYPESNKMYSKMIYVSNKLANGDLKSQNTANKKEASKLLYKAQCNCAYWHGLFGGLYLNYLRNAIYSNLIEAENIISGKGSIEILDYDSDGNDEIIFSFGPIGICVSPFCGGQAVEIDYRVKNFNISNVLARRHETYHEKIKAVNDNKHSQAGPQSIHDISQVKEAGLDDVLFYDKHDRNNFMDHVLDESTTLDDFIKSTYKENGDFINGQYSIDACGSNKIVLSRNDGSLIVKKTFTIGKNNDLNVSYELANPCNNILPIWFGVEFNISLLAGDHALRYYSIPSHAVEKQPMNTQGALDGVSEIDLVDEYQGFKTRLMWDKKALVWRFPVETVSNSEGGLEKTYQGSCIMPSWKFSMLKGESINLRISIVFDEID